jgi:RNA polymerase sigma-70 factor (ECF subfamily)
MAEDQNDTAELLRRSGQGDVAALGMLFARHRDRLLRMVSLRMDSRARGRCDPDDVLQDVYLEAVRRFPEYQRDPNPPFFLWLRLLAMQKLVDLHRRHLGAKARDATREVSLYDGALPQATSAVLASQLLGRNTSPSQAAVRAEMQLRLQEALNGMDEIDREVIALRHFEQLSNGEAAQVLGINASAASTRYVRAMKRLKDVLSSMPELF